MHPNGLAITARVALHDGPVTGGLAAWKWSSATANFSGSTFPEANHLPMQARANKLVRLQDPYFVLNGCQYVKELASWLCGICTECSPFPLHFTLPPTRAAVRPENGPAGTELTLRSVAGYFPQIPPYFLHQRHFRRLSTLGISWGPHTRIVGQRLPTGVSLDSAFKIKDHEWLQREPLTTSIKA